MTKTLTPAILAALVDGMPNDEAAERAIRRLVRTHAPEWLEALESPTEKGPTLFQVAETLMFFSAVRPARVDAVVDCLLADDKEAETSMAALRRMVQDAGGASNPAMRLTDALEWSVEVDRMLAVEWESIHEVVSGFLRTEADYRAWIAIVNSRLAESSDDETRARLAELRSKLVELAIQRGSVSLIREYDLKYDYRKGGLARFYRYFMRNRELVTGLISVIVEQLESFRDFINSEPVLMEAQSDEDMANKPPIPD